MKKVILNIILFAAAAMVLFSCQKSENVAPESISEVTLEFASSKPVFDDETKTEWTGNTIQWSKGDAIRMAYTVNGVWQNAEGDATTDKKAKFYQSKGLEAAGETGVFTVSTYFNGTTEGTYQFYGVYPASVTDTDFNYAPSATVRIPSEQTPAENSFDAGADFMVGVAKDTYTSIPEDAVSMAWTRMVAHAHITLKTLNGFTSGEKVSTIQLIADADADMVGTHYVDITTNEVTLPASNTVANKLLINGDNIVADAEGNVTFWACFLPCTWQTLTVIVETDKATYTRDITIDSGRTFKVNARNVLPINMAAATRVEKPVTSALKLPFIKDFSGITGTSSITELDGFQTLTNIYQNAGAVRVATSKAGCLETVALDLSQKFHVIVDACGWDSDELILTVASGEQTYDVPLTSYGGSSKPGAFVSYSINFEPVGPNATVAFTANGNERYFIQKIQILEGSVALTPVVSVDEPSLSVDAESAEATISYTITNPVDEVALTAEADVDWIHDFNITTGNVSFVVDENTSNDNRSGVVTLSYEGAEPVKVTVTQSAASSGEGGGSEDSGTKYYEKVTSAMTDWTGIYLITANASTANVSGLVAFSAMKAYGSNSYGLYTKISEAESGKILATSEINQYQVEIAKSTNGYTIKFGDYYLGKNGGSNVLQANTTFTAKKYEWTIDFDSSQKITNVEANTYCIKWNNNKNSERFSCYTSAQTDITLYKLSDE